MMRRGHFNAAAAGEASAGIRDNIARTRSLGYHHLVIYMLMAIQIWETAGYYYTGD